MHTKKQRVTDNKGCQNSNIYNKYMQEYTLKYLLWTAARS